MSRRSKFKKELEQLLNRYCIDNDCNTPDFILAEIILIHLDAIQHMNSQRDKWHGWTNKSYHSVLEDTSVEEAASYE